MRYLTVQDMLWVHSLTSNDRNPSFDYANLEEACHYQFGYGTSRDLAAQAARFLTGFQKLAPFDNGNEATAFVGFASFLTLNGQNLDAGEADAEKLARLAGVGPIDGAAIKLAESHAHGEVDVREAVAQTFAQFPKTIAALGKATVGH